MTCLTVAASVACFEIRDARERPEPRHERILPRSLRGPSDRARERVRLSVELAAELDLARLVGRQPPHEHHLLAQPQVAKARAGKHR